MDGASAAAAGAGGAQKRKEEEQPHPCQLDIEECANSEYLIMQ